jgi:putative phosphoribosyl transferase
VLLARVGNGERLSADRQLADQLGAAGMGTAIIELTPPAAESASQDAVQRLADKVHMATTWLRRQPEAAGLPLGYFGTEAGAAVVLAAAATSSVVEAVVTLGGRPDLVAERLASVTTPTLLLVGARDEDGIKRNRAALPKLGGPKRLVLIPGAGARLEAGALAEAGRRAAGWFVQHLAMERTWRAARSGAQPRGQQLAGRSSW